MRLVRRLRGIFCRVVNPIARRNDIEQWSEIVYESGCDDPLAVERISAMNSEEIVESSDSNPSLPVRRRTYQPVWLLGIGILGAVGFFFFQRPSNTDSGGGSRRQAAPQAMPITVATAQKGDIGDYVSALGYVTPLNTVTIRTRVDGELLKLNYREGEIVQKDQILAQIDPALFQAQLTQAQGQYDRDKALLDQARVDLNRYKEAYAKNAIPGQQVDVQQATVRQEEGTVKIDEGQIASARTNLLYTTIRAPITGRVGLRQVDAGNIVHAGDSNGLVVITQLQPITVVFSVAEDYLPQIQQQLRRKQILNVDALDRTQQKKLASGSVTALDNQVDATTGTVRLRALFQNKDNILFANQFVNAKLLIRIEHGVTLIPTAAIQRNGDRSFVYLVKPNQTVEMHDVTTGTTEGEVTVVEGLQPGDVVATDGFDKLQDGVKVAIRNGNESENRSDQGGKAQEKRGDEQGSAK
ncbi:MAG: hypothetical protein DMF61_19560 [Blastocatellia bacterium AA13]|nr:MAG: hypothetical protein DMF61_19560 [Blastocatellia bacterium AA13]